MKFLKLLLNFGNVIGFLLMVLGFFLIPFLIGVPIFIAGILLSILSFYKRWVDFFVPKKTQEKIGSEIIKSYEPYKPALNSMKKVGKEMITTSLKVFVILTIVIIILLVRYILNNREDYWICNEKAR